LIYDVLVYVVVVACCTVVCVWCFRRQNEWWKLWCGCDAVRFTNRMNYL